MDPSQHSTYEAMRHFADSWGMLLIFLFFLGVILWVLRPGSSAEYREVAHYPFEHDDAPLAEEAEK